MSRLDSLKVPAFTLVLDLNLGLYSQWSVFSTYTVSAVFSMTLKTLQNKLKWKASLHLFMGCSFCFALRFITKSIMDLIFSEDSKRMIYKDDQLMWMERERKIDVTLGLYVAFLHWFANEMQSTICALHMSLYVLMSALISIQL